VEVDLAINLEVDEAIVRERMLARGRGDDTPEAIEERLSAYANQTVPAIAWFGSRGILVTVDGAGSPEEVSARLVAAIDDRLGA
jgi:adenylate kinase